MLSAKIRVCSLFLAGSGLVLSAEKPTDTPVLDDVLARTGRYVLSYVHEMTVVLSTEHYSQWVENPGWRGLVHRDLVSEYAIVRVQDDWLGFREVREVDGKTVNDHQNRLEKLFLESPSTALGRAREIADESARYNIGAIQRNFNTPTMALFFLQPSSQPRFSFKKAGEDNVSSVPVWKVTFAERQHPTIVRTKQGKDMPVKGTAWIDPTDGRVLKTNMQITTDARIEGANSWADEPAQLRRGHTVATIQSSASVTVIYKPDESLGLVVPSEMLETYEGPRASSLGVGDGTTKINCRATYGDYRRFEAKSNWSVPK